MRDERGMMLLPFVVLISIGILGAFLLRHPLDREDLIEAQRVRAEQARAAAEGAAALALHRGGDVTGVEIGRAMADATFETRDGRRVIRATARVPSLRGARVTAEIVVPAR